ncbi:hypothetical protein ACP70R_007758 [Stipagrostis hirtigluma subsp. patula]
MATGDDESGDSTGEDYMYDDSDCESGPADYDDGEEGEENKVDASPADKKQQNVVLTEDDVRARQEADTAKVAEVLSISPGIAAVLLRRFKWLPERVQEEWFSDDRRVRDAAGLSGDGVPVPMALSTQRLTCAICFNGYAARRTRSAGCSHFYCDDCWRGYVRAAVDDGARCLSLRCPDPPCPAAVVQELVDEVADDAVKALYARFTLRSYVEESGGRIKWCPGPGCTRAIEFTGSAAADMPDVFCDCKHGFCFRCGEDSHRPVSCDTVRAWMAKIGSDSETANWVVANTKHCPACRRPIEKNQGCMHMTCSAPCHHQFCWVCLDPWDDHRNCDGFRAAEAVVPDAGKRLELTMEEERRRQAKASLDRYLYHYERWAANRASLLSVFKDMAELESSELEKMAAAAGLEKKNFEFLTEAYKKIADGRRVLQWTYAYGYYLDPVHDRKKRDLFEYLQDDANSYLERLHGMAELERREIFCAGGEPAIVAELLSYYQKKVEQLTKVSAKFLGNLVKAFETTELPELESLNYVGETMD